MIKIYNYKDIANCDILKRSMSEYDVSSAVRVIIDDVRENGDAALRKYTEKFDGVVLDFFKVTDEEFEEALSVTEPEFIAILKKAAENIRNFHSQQKRNSYIVSGDEGVLLGQRIIPIDRAGLYVPGGTAAYPSTVLMDAIPAKIAGCKNVIMTTPPQKNGKIAPQILAAAKIAGIDSVYKIGGAQAIAALAYGTESIPGVDKIVGPGNAFVAEAKKQVYGKVSIDMIAGPSEILVIADGESSAKNIAADLLSQSEHDKLASAVLVTDSVILAKRVQDEIENQLGELERKEIASASIDNNGKIIVTESIDQAVDIANELSPEHLELCLDDPFDYLEKIKNVGSVFMGRNCPEALGDYFAGPNHTLPTGGSARFSSPLSVDDFIKKSQFIYYTDDALRSAAASVDYFAKKEGLTAHAKSVTIRLEGETK